VNRHCLVSDFDGTITGEDFYTLIAQRYMGPDAMDIWEDYRAGKITHFEAMQSFFSHAPGDETELNALLRDTKPDPRLGEAARKLREAGQDLIIVSAGSSWYIDRVLAEAGVQPTTVHANPGTIVAGRGLVLRWPKESRFFSPDVGIDKAAVVSDALRRYKRVAFAGDGPPDLSPSLLVPPDRRFARGFLAGELQRRSEGFIAYEKWADVVDSLLDRGEAA
jgi:2-hydroxy-3-keto-5-methylthiopentenyl-1-phosphate phosphatase